MADRLNVELNLQAHNLPQHALWQLVSTPSTHLVLCAFTFKLTHHRDCTGSTLHQCFSYHWYVPPARMLVSRPMVLVVSGRQLSQLQLLICVDSAG